MLEHVILHPANVVSTQAEKPDQWAFQLEQGLLDQQKSFGAARMTMVIKEVLRQSCISLHFSLLYVFGMFTQNEAQCEDVHFRLNEFNFKIVIFKHEVKKQSNDCRQKISKGHNIRVTADRKHQQSSRTTAGWGTDAP